ncbi:MAG: putative ABC transporter permease [Acutalibacteraceae bacterium]|nr:putative ABC transporter permease [Acutalibacteraceae bacterium]
MLFITDFFFVYSFFGCVLETAFSLIVYRRLEIRKTTRFLPFCPVYGCGALALYYMLTPFNNYPIIVVILGTVIGTTVEYVYGYVTLKLYRVLLWDYKEEKRHYNRLITPIFTALWAALAPVFVYVISPTVTPLIAAFPEYISYILLFLLIFDTAATIKMLSKIRDGDAPESYLCPVIKKV